MPNCKGCSRSKQRLACLKCEQQDELSKNKHMDRAFSIITHRSKERLFVDFPTQMIRDNAVWILLRLNWTEKDIGQVVGMSERTVRRLKVQFIEAGH